MYGHIATEYLEVWWSCYRPFMVINDVNRSLKTVEVVMVHVIYLMTCALSLFLFCNLATCGLISGWVPICGSAHSWWLYSAAPQGDQAVSTMTQCPTQSHYPGTELTSPCPSLIIPSTYLGSDKYQFCKSLVWVGWESNPRSSTPEAYAVPIWPPSPVCSLCTKGSKRL